MRPDSKDATLALASALAGQHHFADAVALILPIVEGHPEDDPSRLVLGDAQLALGEVTAAAQLYEQVAQRVQAPGVEARLAQLDQIRGHNADAIDHMKQAIKQLEADAAETDETTWYYWRLADLYLYTGQPELAAAVLRDLLGRSPDYQPAVIGLALTSCARGEVDVATRLMEQAVARSPDFPQLVALGDLDALAGNLVQAKAAHIRAARAGEIDTHLARPFAIFLIDHDRSPQRALQLAEDDLKLRHDVYTYDLLAWAQLANGQIAQASQSIVKALSEGTQDAQILYHAGMIALAEGNRPLAQARLEQAMRVNPYFSLSQRDKAIATLNQLHDANVADETTSYGRGGCHSK
jgi:tetratricopeptide (TPR) repeat protein